MLKRFSLNSMLYGTAMWGKICCVDLLIVSMQCSYVHM